MLSSEFFGQNFHFIISLFAALVFFAVFWLYFDAWLAQRDRKREIFKWAGFLLLAVAFLVYATVTEQTTGGSVSSLETNTLLASQLLSVLGFASIVVSELIDPLQREPEVKRLGAKDFVGDVPTAEKPKKKTKKNHALVTVAGFTTVLHFLNPLGALAIAVLYWRRATVGLERHLKPVSIGFFLLFGFELLSVGSVWSGTGNPSLSKFLANFGPLWTAEHVLLLAAALVLGWWVWQYLTERFVSQLFMLFASLTLGLFLVTTVGFTYLLDNNVKNSALDNLHIANSTLNYAIGTKKSTTLADAETVAENPTIQAAVAADSHDQLTGLTNNFLFNKSISSLVITDANAEVLLRAENPDRYGDSVSSDPQVRRALIGQESSSVTTQPGVLAPAVSISSTTPIYGSNGQIVGTATVALVLDNAFVAGVKQSTGLDSAIYANNVVSATTFLSPDGLTHWVGVKAASGGIQNSVLKNGQTYKGLVTILNRQFLGVYSPLKDVNNSTVGMLFIGQPAVDVERTADHSIQLTFLLTTILLVLSVVPAYYMARYIAKQLE